MERVATGSRILDGLLHGGLPPGTAVLVDSEEGAGGTEFAMAVLHAALEGAKPHKARYLTTLRSAARLEDELEALFPDKKLSGKVDLQETEPQVILADPSAVVKGLARGDVVVLESADTLVNGASATELLPLWRKLGDAAQASGALVILLHAHGTLSPQLDRALHEGADVILTFTWHSGGPVRRRQLCIPKLRGLAPIVDGEQVPVFDVALHRGMGFAISRDKSVI